jgi:tRNA A-37 threonylcarbamoyl transferase component Bud32
VATDTPTKPPDSEPVQILFGKYVIHRLLGIGGMAEIYQASVSGPAGFQKPVVIKRVRSQYAQDETFVQMFVDEARICASLDHANLVTVFDFGQEQGHYYMAMELVDGMDLRTAHVRHAQAHGKPLPWGVSTVVVRDALRGLDYAHHLAGPDGKPLGIVHRDIDLANIMVRRDGAVKVLDFGCAKASSAIRRTQTVAGVIKGKLGYMSPEQADDRPLDGRSDVFAASIVLHELLTGRRLFFGDEPAEVIRSVLTRPIPDPRDKNPAVPPDLAAVVMRGLSRDREARYPSAGAMADALEAIAHAHRLGSAQVAEVFAPLITASRGGRGAAFESTRDERKLTLAAWTESTGDAEPLEIISGVLVDEADESATADGAGAGAGAGVTAGAGAGADAAAGAAISASAGEGREAGTGAGARAAPGAGAEAGAPAGAGASGGSGAGGVDSAADAPFIDATIVTTNPRWMLPDEAETRVEPSASVSVAAAAGAGPGAGAHASAVGSIDSSSEIAPDFETAPEVDLHAQPTELVDRRAPGHALDAMAGDLHAEPIELKARREPAISLSEQETILLTEAQRKGGPSAAPGSARSRMSGLLWTALVITGLLVLAVLLLYGLSGA